MSDAGRRARAAGRRDRMVLRKGRMTPQQADLDVLTGAEAVSLVRRLTEESWALAGLEMPSYTRDRIPCRFVPRRAV